MRSAVQYDLSRGGTIKFDVSLASGNLPTSSAVAGWPWIGFLSLPYSAPSTPSYNGGAPIPQDGVYVNFREACRLLPITPQVLRFTDFGESEVASRGTVWRPDDGCRKAEPCRASLHVGPSRSVGDGRLDGRRHVRSVPARPGL